MAVATHITHTAERDADTAPVLRLMRAEYVEMPGLSLDVRQAARLWNLSEGVSEDLLTRLRLDGFLACTAHGRYVRA